MRRFAAFLVVAAASGAAFASWGDRVLIDPSYSPPPSVVPGFQSTTQFVGPGSGGTLDCLVDYAVFLPGQFPTFFNDQSGSVIPPLPGYNAGTDYVYAYQVHNYDPAHGGTSNLPASQVNVSMGSNLGAVTGFGLNNTFDPGAGQIIPTAAFDLGNSTLILFATPTIGPGEYSALLLLSSPYPPVLQNATMVDGGVGINAPLPAPIPEPASLALLGLGLAVAAARRR